MLDYIRIHILIVDDSQIFRDMIAVGMARDPSIKVKVITGDINTLLSQEKNLSEYTAIVLGAETLTLDIKNKIIEFSAKNVGKMIVLTNDKSLEGNKSSQLVILERPVLGNMRSFEIAIANIISKVKNEPYKEPVPFSSSSLKRTISCEEAEKVNRLSKKIERSGVINQKVIAIGSSTGGTEALKCILEALPAIMPPILVVQHMPPVFTELYAQRINKECRLETREAKTGDVLRPGLVLIAPGDLHMTLQKNGNQYYVECAGDEKVGGHCPAVNVLFDSVAQYAGDNAIGIILTGMGKDGADGLLKMRRAGARTIGQDKASCVVYGMPKAAYEIGAVEKQVPLEQIPSSLMELLQ